jgi:hypothetical protein
MAISKRGAKKIKAHLKKAKKSREKHERLKRELPGKLKALKEKQRKLDREAYDLLGRKAVQRQIKKRREEKKKKMAKKEGKK